MKARVSQLHKTESEWKKLEDWTPEAGEIVVYDPDSFIKHARLKVGDGKNSLKNLPFFIDATVATYLQKQRYNELLDGGRVTDYK